VILLTDTKANIVIVVPFTTNVQALRFPHTIEVKPSKINGLDSISVALVFQVRALDKKRLKKQIGTLEEVTLKEISSFLKKMLNL